MLQEEAALLEELRTHPGWNLLVKRALERQLKEQKYLVQGRCLDHQEYIKLCSFTDGIEFVTSLPGRVKDELDRAVSERKNHDSDSSSGQGE